MTNDSPQAPAADPLAEASPKSLQELFSADPLGLNDRDIDKIIAELRAHRERIVAAGGDAAKVAKKAPKIIAEPGKLKLSDLDL